MNSMNQRHAHRPKYCSLDHPVSPGPEVLRLVAPVLSPHDEAQVQFARSTKRHSWLCVTGVLIAHPNFVAKRRGFCWTRKWVQFKTASLLWSQREIFDGTTHASHHRVPVAVRGLSGKRIPVFLLLFWVNNCSGICVCVQFNPSSLCTSGSRLVRTYRHVRSIVISHFTTPSHEQMGSARKGIWTTDEHDRFLDAISHLPHGPWSSIAKYVATRSARQVQTHAQKYYEKVARHLRGLQRDRKPVGGNEHRIEERILSLLLSAGKAPAVERSVKLCRASEDARRDSHHDTTPPCLLRLRELPSSPVSVENVMSASRLTKEPAPNSHEREEEAIDGCALPSLEQSLDYLIEILSSSER